MTLEEWDAAPGLGVLDIECWTVARAMNPRRHRNQGYVVFATPLSYRVWWFRTLGEVAIWLRRPLEEIVGVPYFDTDWLRDQMTTPGWPEPL